MQLRNKGIWTDHYLVTGYDADRIRLRDPATGDDFPYSVISGGGAEYEFDELPPLYKKRSDGTYDELNVTLKTGSDPIIRTVITHPTRKEKVYETPVAEVSSKPIAQVCVERAVSKWTKKKERDGWSVVKGEAELAEPMLLHKWEEYKHLMTYPALLSPKLNGVRATYKASDLSLYSRKRSPFTLPALLEELKRINMSMDGELWNPDLSFEELVGIIKAKTDARKDHIQYWVFDRFTKGEYILRLASLMRALASRSTKRIFVVPCIQVNNEAEVDYWFDLIMKEKGVDGVVVRTMDYEYQFDIRSKNVLKKKAILSAEFECAGIASDSDTLGPLLAFIMVTEDGKQFKVTPDWPKERRAEEFKAGKKYIGQHFTLEFREYTSNGIPKHITSVTARDYE